MVLNIKNVEDFNTVVTNNAKVIVDFHADWCAPCRAAAPKFKAMAADFPSWKFCAVNVDDVPDVAVQHKVQSIPTFIFFTDGMKTNTVIGVDFDRIKQLLG